jgi:speckle-type POZ protein
MSLSPSYKSYRRSGTSFCSICRQNLCTCRETVLTRSLNRDLFSLKSKSYFSDFIIQVGECIFPVHRSILAARSNVFLTMFQQTDTIEMTSSILILDDEDPSSIDLFLQYLYSDTCVFTEEKKAEQMLELADKYNVESLKLLTEDYFSLNKDNCLHLLILADRHTAIRLKQSAIKFINNNLTQIFAQTGTADWTTFRQTYPNLVADLYEKVVSLSAILK